MKKELFCFMLSLIFISSCTKKHGKISYSCPSPIYSFVEKVKLKNDTIISVASNSTNKLKAMFNMKIKFYGDSVHVDFSNKSTDCYWVTWEFYETGYGHTYGPFPSNDTTTAYAFASGKFKAKLIAHSSYGANDSVETQFEFPINSFLAIPNLLTPNGDGLNDGLFILMQGISDQNFVLVIKDNKNNSVYNSTDKIFNWPQDNTKEGVYNLKLAFKTVHGTPGIAISTVTLFKQGSNKCLKKCENYVMPNQLGLDGKIYSSTNGESNLFCD